MAERLVSFPELGAVWCNSPSMRSALLSYLHYRDLLGEFDTVHCRENDDGLLFEYWPDEQQAIGETSAWFNFELLVGIAEHYAGEIKMLIDVELAGAIGARWRTLADACPVSLHADRGRFSLELRSAVLDSAYACHHPILDAHARSLLDSQLTALRQTSLFSSRLRQTLLDVLDEDDFERCDESLLKMSCDRLGMSRWTVQRYLQAEGLSFSALLQQMRGDEAYRLLCESDLPLTEVSERLGFCSQSSFTRFFTTHFGQSPARFRKGR